MFLGKLITIEVSRKLYDEEILDLCSKLNLALAFVNDREADLDKTLSSLLFLSYFLSTSADINFLLFLCIILDSGDLLIFKLVFGCS